MFLGTVPQSPRPVGWLLPPGRLSPSRGKAAPEEGDHSGKAVLWAQGRRTAVLAAQWPAVWGIRCATLHLLAVDSCGHLVNGTDPYLLLGPILGTSRVAASIHEHLESRN